MNGPGELHAVEITTTRHFLWWYYKDCETNLPNEDNPVAGVARPFNFQWRAAANNRRVLNVLADGRTNGAAAARRLQTDTSTSTSNGTDTSDNTTLANSTSTDSLFQGNPVRLAS